MSPEQAAGEKVDFRSDQFSFGTILYEMASGANPFPRNTAAETLTAIIREEPERLDPSVAAPLRWNIAKSRKAGKAVRSAIKDGATPFGV